MLQNRVKNFGIGPPLFDGLSATKKNGRRLLFRTIQQVHRFYGIIKNVKKASLVACGLLRDLSAGPNPHPRALKQFCLKLGVQENYTESIFFACYRKAVFQMLLYKLKSLKKCLSNFAQTLVIPKPYNIYPEQSH